LTGDAVLSQLRSRNETSAFIIAFIRSYLR
jgi:hypothetical protein